MEKSILTWPVPLQLHRLSLRVVACALLATLGACSSVPWSSHQAQADLDPQALVNLAPPALGARQSPAALAGLEGGPATRTDPSSGLSVDLGNRPLQSTRDAPGASIASGHGGSGTSGSAPKSSGPGNALDAAVGQPIDPLRPDATLNLSDVSATQDLWGRIRRGFAMPELNSELVAEHEHWYASRPEYVQRMTQRGSRYLYHVVEELSRRQMPMELALLPFIESAFNPQALSTARASGMWQFTPSTGKDFELKQSLFRDDRRDVLASTRAALDYLQRLNRQFGDWQLALAAYNWGEGNVQRAIARNQRMGLPCDYLSLNMPAETRNYVPKLYAVRHIIAEPERFGLNLPALENHPYFVSVPIQRDMDAALAARLAGLASDEFKALNPSQNKPVILAAATPQVLLPYDNASLFLRNLGEYKGPLASWTAWQVPKTMRPAEAARRVGMNESSLRQLNQIPPKMLVKAGSTLLVPRPQTREDDVSENLADNAVMALAPDQPPLRRISLRLSRRDNLASVARRYHVSTQQLAQWNHCSPQAAWHRGQVVAVYVPQGGRTSRALAQAATQADHGSMRVAHAGRHAGHGVRLASVRGGVHGSHYRPAAKSTRIRVASAR